MVQRLSRGLLHAMWRHWHGVEPTPIGRSGPPIALWRSACGLMFFHPPVAGDTAFYQRYYKALGVLDRPMPDPAERPEFVEAARHVRAGDRVLDVGAGRGGLEALLPAGATWQGLDPHLPEEVPNIARETLQEHAARHAGRYDVVCAFQVLEHVEDIRGFAAAMAACLKPGGRMVVCVPLWPSPLTEIPNLPMNAPPHHLSWWTVGALRRLAEVLGLTVLRAEVLPPPRHAAPLLWLHRLLVRRTEGDLYFAHRWGWWASLALAGLVARPMLSWRRAPLPPRAGAIDAFLVAEKPAG